jgi:glutaconate CoA-transferase subunit B
VPRVILFREEHTPRVFVDKVDFVSAPGVSSPHIHRPGGPAALLTGKALFSFDKARPRLRAGERPSRPGPRRRIKAATGFAFAHGEAPPATAAPGARVLALLRGRVLDELSETYPDFARQTAADIAGLDLKRAGLRISLRPGRRRSR